MIDLSRAAEILEALANGVNPETGEALENESVLNQPDVIRSLYAGLSLIKKAQFAAKFKDAKQKQPKPDNMPKNYGKLWRTEDQDLMVRQFRAGRNFDDIAKELGRTRDSIIKRLIESGYLVWNGEKYVRATPPPSPDLPPLPPLDGLD